MRNSNLKDPKFKDNLKSYFTRFTSDTPPFFKKLRLVGLVAVAAGTALVAAPIALPTALLTVGGYLIVGGTVASAISQAVIAEDGKKSDE